ncbi:hypothetical protein GCHA_1279 [Paraglaciecola chathamensis S18K6]|uniref:Uncharacterized protein n=1 Tax=Paraglaciecola chathamensis S18K6 TaxID=1127672 RepID=A0AAV3UWG8_9ALTE|nr:hypothetical protein GCHA_1279 [Paraglaciecola chathamensis S18K6]
MHISLIIDNSVYTTSRIDFQFRQSQRLPYDFIEYFIKSLTQKGTAPQKAKDKPNATLMLPIKCYVKNICHSKLRRLS